MPKLILISILMLSACTFQSKYYQVTEQEISSLFNRGVMHLKTGDLDQAQIAFNLILELKTIPEALDGLGCVALRRQEYRMAQKFFILAWQIDPKYTQAVANLAYLYEITGKLDLAERTYQNAVIQAPTNYQLRNNYGAFLYDSVDKNPLNKDFEKHVLAYNELLKARQISDDLIIQGNLNKLKEHLGIN